MRDGGITEKTSKSKLIEIIRGLLAVIAEPVNKVLPWFLATIATIQVDISIAADGFVNGFSFKSYELFYNGCCLKVTFNAEGRCCFPRRKIQSRPRIYVHVGFDEQIEKILRTSGISCSDRCNML